jgi:hypothetical protein
MPIFIVIPRLIAYFGVEPDELPDELFVVSDAPALPGFVVLVELPLFGMLPPLLVGVCGLMPSPVFVEPLLLMELEPEFIEPEFPELIEEPEFMEADGVLPGLLSCC